MTYRPIVVHTAAAPHFVRVALDRAKSTITDAYAAHQDRYYADPAGWVDAVIDWREGEGLAPYQREALTELHAYGRYAMRGPHGLGKTTVEALALLHFAITRDRRTDWKVPTTASAWRQLTHYLWPEVHKWARRMKWGEIGRAPLKEGAELQLLGLRLETGSAFAAAAKDPALIEGAHATEMLYLFDEAKAIPDPIWDAAEGAFSTTAGRVLGLAVSTPGEPSGRFYQIHRRARGYEDWAVRHVRTDEAIAAGRLSDAWVRQRALQWGDTSTIYKRRVKGDFASDEQQTIIPLSWVELAVEQWHAWMDELDELDDPDTAIGPLIALGADVAGEGAASTVFAPRFGGYRWGRFEEHRRINPIHTAGLIKARILAETIPATERSPGHRPYAVVDVIGLGSGTHHTLMQEGIDSRPFNAAEGTKMMDRARTFGFLNVRAAAWWNMREILDPSNGYRPCLPPDDRLIGELTVPKWFVTGQGRIQVESKDDLMKPDRLGHSTDYADALIMSAWEGGKMRAMFV